MSKTSSLAIFQRGSKTYYGASRFFPKEVREDVTTLYAFVRLADDFVDRVPQDKVGFERFVKEYRKMRESVKRKQSKFVSTTDQSSLAVIEDFCKLSELVGIEDGWADSFLAAMRADLTKKTYQTLTETTEYMYGSAEVIGLMLSQIFGLPKKAHYTAQMLGRAMQYANFIRDIAEDVELGRQYLPVDHVAKFGLSNLQVKTALAHLAEFKELMMAEIAQYRQWQREAEAGYQYLPKRIRVAVKTAADMYIWATDQIAHDPMIVYRKKVKPGKVRILLTGFRNIGVISFAS